VITTLLFTGATGFLGNNILPELNKQFTVVTADLSDKADYKINLVKDIPQFTAPFDIILHAAGKAHSIPKTEADIQAFYDVNLLGTQNFCKALENCGVPRSFIFISTVAVYGCETGENILEDHPLNGTTPYAKSKILAEQYLQEWCAAHNVILTILRPSLIAGTNPPGNLAAMINGMRSGKYLSIAGGKARKSIAMAQDIARLIPLVETKGGIYNICDDTHPSFRELEVLISRQLSIKPPVSIPYWTAKSLALIGDMLGNKAPINSSKLDKITKSLTFSNEKLKTELNFVPTDVLANFKIQ